MSTIETTIEAYHNLSYRGKTNDRLVGSWAMQKDGEQKMLELHNYTMRVKNPNECILPYSRGHVGIITEFFDIALGLNPGFVHKQWPFYADWLEGDKYPYSYGDIIKSQWDKVKEKLRKNPNTRHASIFCWDMACHDRDFVPCTHMFHFQMIDGKLCLTVTMRSQDAIKGWYLDSFLYCHLLCIMAGQLGLEVGHYTVFQHNIHVYPGDIDLFAKRLIELEECSGYNHCKIPPLTNDDYPALLEALNYVYSEESLYSVDPLHRIESDYYKSLMALIYAYRWKEEPLGDLMVSPALKALDNHH